MPFTGTPVVTDVGQNIKRITGLTLAASAVGTISNDGGGGDATLPEGAETIDENTEVVVQQSTGGALAPFVISEAAGVISVTNQDTTNASGALVILVKNQHTMIR
jgi:hypothetical protein